MIDIDEVAGCTNSTAINFNSNATDDDGSCDYLHNEPCTEDLCWDGSQRNPSDCSCPPENKDSDSNSDKIVEEEFKYPWLILVVILVLIIVYVSRLKKSSNQ